MAATQMRDPSGVLSIPTFCIILVAKPMDVDDSAVPAATPAL